VLRRWHKINTLVLSSDNLWLYQHSGEVTDIPVNVFTGRPSLFSAAVTEQLTTYSKLISDKPLHIVLSNALVRYAVLPWQSNLYSQRDWLAVAENHMRQVYGNAAAAWQVQISMQGFGQPLVIMAADRALLEGLETLSRQQRWRLQKIEPAFATVANYYRRRFRNNAWLLLAEEQRLLLAQATNGVWQRFSVAIPPPGEARQHAVRLVMQARQLVGSDKGVKLYLHGCADLLLDEFTEDFDVHILSPGQAHNKSGQQMNYGHLI
jgi:hypothetical protein